MNKKLKIITILAATALLFVYWLVLALTGTKLTMANYVWQILLAVAALSFAVFGMMTAKHWSWLKSGVGQGVFFISLGLLMWGIGQAGWALLVIKDPANQTPPTHILDYIYFSSIPIWTYGMFKLSKATGAKYGLRGMKPKVAVAVMATIMLAFSYWLLVVVARGGPSYYSGWGDFQGVLFDIGYAVGDAINLTFALAIFGLSWKYLGGMFKRPILMILSGFALIYLADFLFSFYDGKHQYYNGHWTDILYLAMVATFGAGLCLLDPAEHRQPTSQPAMPQTGANPEPVAQPAAEQTPVATTPEQPAATPEPAAVTTEPATPPSAEPKTVTVAVNEPATEQPQTEASSAPTTAPDAPAPAVDTPPSNPEQSTNNPGGTV